MQTQESLPKDIIFSILLRIPTEVLHEVMKHVCKEWYGIVHDSAFISTHFQRSRTSTGLIFRHREIDKLALYAELTPRLEITELPLPFPAQIARSCDGLILLQELTNPHHRHQLHVVNLFTKMKITLPLISKRANIKKRIKVFSSALSCTKSGQYKVVHVCMSNPAYPGFKAYSKVFTVGVDTAWRHIDFGNTVASGEQIVLEIQPLSIAGCLYWMNIPRCDACFGLDVDTETLHRLLLPDGHNYDGRSIDPTRFIPIAVYMEAALGLLTRCQDSKRLTLWRLIDMKSSTWAKIVDMDDVNISLRAEFQEFQKMHNISSPLRSNMPLCWKPQLRPCWRNGELWFPTLVRKFFERRPNEYIPQDLPLICYNH